MKDGVNTYEAMRGATSRRILELRLKGLSYAEIGRVTSHRGSWRPGLTEDQIDLAYAVYNNVMPRDREILRQRDTPQGFYARERFG